MRVKFSKMHGLGNDFVMLDGISQKIKLTPEKIRRLADRCLGVGCDQVLLVESPRTPEADFRYRIFNADGSEVENCGNGARCFARFVRERRLTGKKRLRVETAAGILLLKVLDSDRVSVDLGAPVLEPEQIPFSADRRADSYPLEINHETFTIGAVSMGNPHAVLLVEDVTEAPVDRLGPLLECHPRFPQKVNVGFLQIDSRDEAQLRVFERGVGETRACGTGACAAMVYAHLRGLVNDEVRIQLPGGALTIHWSGPGQPVTMSGPTTTVFHGQIIL
ncbi:diaminopimelate epimerase [Microbulbifer sp. OS29]|uniref:Diaminopimelate epimerase n=1 Tax=Microbulbifer okhotskensis TaxID=2926617 RepID=A0A9X2J6Q2_9GAMM|nr:diaminopimelate epimerase [Microbulbifer okhotskensis]MCO1334860.1 diaminopimelate epimerase [Microbulbifer okhotskensis]